MNSFYHNPLVSVVVVTYNSFCFIVETLESIKSQTYTNIELIISDDGSTDATVRLCRDWLEINDKRFVRAIVLTSERNTGIPANCNRGIIAARGQWIKLIAGDDLLIDSCISSYVSIIQDNKSLVFFSNVERYVDDFSEKNKLKLDCFDKYKINQPHLSVDDQFQILLRVNNIFTASLFYSKELFELVGYFDESLRYWEDRPMLIRVSQSKIRLQYVNFESCKYRLHSSSVQRKNNVQFFFNNFEIERAKYVYTNYIHFFPFFEKLTKKILYYLIMNSNFLGINSKSKFINNIIYILIFRPLLKIEKFINRKFVY